MQKFGLEWALRLMLEPKRLFSRYARNARFILSMVLRDLSQGPGQPQKPQPAAPTNPPGSQR
jgi:hypothetical protein